MATFLDLLKMAFLVSVEDFEQMARARLGGNAWNYYSSGATTQHTLRNNVEAFSRYITATFR